jgi:hypothetical protein
MHRDWSKPSYSHSTGHLIRIFHLLEIGIRGNTHFAFPDLNNTVIADLLSGFLTESGRDDD